MLRYLLGFYQLPKTPDTPNLHRGHFLYNKEGLTEKAGEPWGLNPWLCSSRFWPERSEQADYGITTHIWAPRPRANP